MPACNRQFGASGGVASWDTSQDFGSSPPVQALPIPPPDAKLLKRCVQADWRQMVDKVYLRNEARPVKPLEQEKKKKYYENIRYINFVYLFPFDSFWNSPNS